MPLFRAITAVAILTIACVAVSQGQEKKIEMTHVKYDGLKQEVLKHRGKVVVLDFWATWCPSCMQHFPDFIEMQKKYGDKGLVVISVSLDKTDKDAVDRANRFLTKQNSPLRNLLLDEPTEVWEKQFDFKSLPFYYVFDRHGKWVRFRTCDYESKKDGLIYEDLDKAVVQMLSEK
jgi:thiol-disulfide isomerase/thioredoxin